MAVFLAMYFNGTICVDDAGVHARLAFRKARLIAWEEISAVRTKGGNITIDGPPGLSIGISGMMIGIRELREELARRRPDTCQMRLSPHEHVRYLAVGGLVAIGCDPTGRFLLAVSHSGRGVFSTETWERVARSCEVTYPENGVCAGIGPIAGMSIPVVESYDGWVMRLRVRGFEVVAESSGNVVKRAVQEIQEEGT